MQRNLMDDIAKEMEEDEQQRRVRIWQRICVGSAIAQAILGYVSIKFWHPTDHNLLLVRAWMGVPLGILTLWASLQTTMWWRKWKRKLYKNWDRI